MSRHYGPMWTNGAQRVGKVGRRARSWSVMSRTAAADRPRPRRVGRVQPAPIAVDDVIGRPGEVRQSGEQPGCAHRVSRPAQRCCGDDLGEPDPPRIRQVIHPGRVRPVPPFVVQDPLHEAAIRVVGETRIRKPLRAAPSAHCRCSPRSRGGRSAAAGRSWRRSGRPRPCPRRRRGRAPRPRRRAR